MSNWLLVTGKWLNSYSFYLLKNQFLKLRDFRQNAQVVMPVLAKK